MSKSQITALIQNKSKIDSQRQIIFKLVCRSEDINEYQISARSGLNKRTVRSRVSELKRDGLIRIVGTFNNGHNSTYAKTPDNEVQSEKEIQKELKKQRIFNSILEFFPNKEIKIKELLEI